MVDSASATLVKMRLLIGWVAIALIAGAAETGKAVRIAAAEGGRGVLPGQPIQIAISLAEPGGLKPILPSVWIDEWTGGAPMSDEACAARAKSLQTASARTRQATRDLNVYYLVTIGANGLLQVTDPRTGFGGSRLVTAFDFQAEPLAWAHDIRARRLLLAFAGRKEIVVIDTVSWRQQKSWDAGGEIEDLFHDASQGVVWSLTTSGRWTRFDTTGLASANQLPAPGSLTFSEDGTTMLSSKDSSWLLREGKPAIALAKRKAVRTVWSAAADAFVSVTPSGGLEMWSADGELEAVLPAGHYPADTELRLTEDGRFALNWTPSRNHVRIADLSARRWRGELLIDTPSEVFPSRDFVYVRSSAIAEILVVPMESIRGTRNIQGRKVAGGTSAQTRTRFGSVATLSGAELVFWSDRQGDQVYAYHPGMNAASGGLKVQGKPVGLLLAGPPLVEEKAGEFRAEFTLPNPGHYVAVLSSSQPKRQECVVFQVDGEPNRKSSRFRVSLSQTNVPVGREATLSLKIEGEPKPQAVRMLLLSIDGQWQNRYWAEVKPDGTLSVPVSLPHAGEYWMTFEIPGEAMSHRRFPRLSLEAVAQ